MICENLGVAIFKPEVVVIGLGYVGLPLAVAFSKVKHVLGFDIDAQRITDLRNQIDKTNEISDWKFLDNSTIEFTDDISNAKDAQFFIVTVPTPVNDQKEPDLKPLIAACEFVGSIIKHGAIVIFESTVYPGATEEICVPRIESKSGLKFNKDFFVGYSPERINPGDNQHKLEDIVKVVSGSDAATLQKITSLYSEIIDAGVHQASSIKVAEAAKVIENTQRDLNIALINELAMIFDKLDIDTTEVLNAAGTKWNFHKFTPGLVGGHCIGVDPYYLTHKAQSVGYEPKVILSGRKINDEMGQYIADRFVLELNRRKEQVNGTNCLILGLTFKENCPDLRNTGVLNVIRALESYGIDPVVVDPWADEAEARKLYQIDLVDIENLREKKFDHAIVTVAHQEFIDRASALRELVSDGIIFDIKSALPREMVNIRL